MKRSFMQILNEVRFGEAAEELTDKLQELVAAVDNTQKQGELTFKLVLKPGAGGTIEILDTIKTKIPEPKKGASLFFATVEGNLTMNNPRQPDLPGVLREVDTPKTAVRDA